MPDTGCCMTRRFEFWRQGAAWGVVGRGGLAARWGYKGAEWIEWALGWFNKKKECCSRIGRALG